MKITSNSSWEEELKIISMDTLFLPAKDPDADDSVILSKAADYKTRRSRARMNKPFEMGLKNEKSLCMLHFQLYY